MIFVRLWAFGAFIVGIAGTVLAQQTPDVSAMPLCATNCMLDALPRSSCAPSDFDCLCADKPLLNNVKACVLGNCTVKQSITTNSVTAALCKVPVRSRASKINSIYLTITIVSTLFVGIRIFTRTRYVTTGLGLDDVTVCMSLVAAIACAVITYRVTLRGYGKDIWGVNVDAIEFMMKAYYAGQLIYIFANQMVKISLLLLYLRIFPSQSARLRIHIILGIAVAMMISFEMVLAFQCKPISGAWTSWAMEIPSKCINTNAAFFAYSGCGILLDVIILTTPIPELLTLEVPLRTKFYIFGMFLVGFFITIVTILRLHSLTKQARTLNFTYDYAPITWWSALEMNVAIFCACLPTLRPLLRRTPPSTQYDSGRSHLSHSVSTKRSTTTMGKKSVSDTETQSDCDDAQLVPLDSSLYHKELRQGASIPVKSTIQAEE